MRVTSHLPNVGQGCYKLQPLNLIFLRLLGLPSSSLLLIPSLHMLCLYSCYPKVFSLELNAILRKFWWGFPHNKTHNLTLLAWDNNCKLKSLGGLGIRSMDFMNLSLLARLGWKLTSKQPLIYFG
jgi:hypothetical protein